MFGTFSRCENASLAVYEALAAGLPVVQPRHGAFPEWIEATGGGVLVEPQSPAALAERRPGIVYLTISAFSRAGPWAQRRGYDTLVAAASGLTRSGNEDPARLPCQPLDYLTGYLGAFGAMLALQRRAMEGGSWHVQLSLERTSAWIREMTDALGRETGVASEVPHTATISDLYAESASRFGLLRHLKPVVQMAETPARWECPPVPLGSDPARWAD